MNKDTQTKEYLQKLQNLKLSESSRARMEKSLLEYAQFHGVSEGVRVGADTRSIEQVPRRTSLFSLKRMYMPFVILLAVMVGGGTSYAAQGAVPGDFLYAVKTEVNEPVRSAFAVGANAEADLQANIVAERIEEAQELKADGKLKGEVAAKLAANIQKHIQKAEAANRNSTDTVRSRTNAGLTVALQRFNTLVGSDTALAIGLAAGTDELSTDAALSTSLLAGEIDPQMMRANTQARVDSLLEVVAESKAEVSTEIYLSLTSKLDTAAELMIEAQTQAEAKSQQSVEKAAELAGEVEATLTTLGTARVDTDTGLILDIDFSTVPARERNPEVEEGNGSDTSETESGVELDMKTDAQINTGSDGTEANVNGALRSGLNI